MKKAVFLPVLVAFCVSLLSACVSTGHPNILLFTDNLNSVGTEKIELSDYTLVGSDYKLLFEGEGYGVLLTVEENEKGEIKKIRLTLSKTDEEGKLKAPTDAEVQFYKEKANQVLQAFTLFEEEKCDEITKKILPSKSEDFLKTGELTMDADSFHLVYYSNKICCQFTVTNTYLEKTELTEKPVSKPLYEVTANISGED